MNRLKSIKLQSLFVFPFVMYLLSSCGQAEDGLEQNKKASQIQVAKAIGTVKGESQAQFMAHLAHKIWLNETGGDDAKLLWWNDGEGFPSLGIGHFIWFPKGFNAPFEESFPELLKFMHEHNQALPDWLEKPLMAKLPIDAPWRDKATFIQARNTQKVNELLQLLQATKTLQAEFIAMRFHDSREGILKAAGAHKARVSARINSLTESPAGQFALIDYVNFKGEGLNPTERYQGRGWGLLQVLVAMEQDSLLSPVEQFIGAAKATLALRVDLSPPERNEARWLEGWYARLDAYRL